MAGQLQKNNQEIVQSHDEHILVVQRDLLFPDGAWQGLKNINFDTYIEIINAKKEFLPRSSMEQDPRYKQIIPYLIFTHNNNYFLMQRRAETSEQRLKNKYTLGIGGHIRQEDMQNSSIFDWATREFHEEVNYSGNLSITGLGILNDDSNEVGKVHIGFVLLLQGDSANISVKSELKSGALLSFQECAAYMPSMESWSQMVMDQLQQ